MNDFTQFTAHVNTIEQGPMELTCTPDNTTLYLHHPDRWAMYDHFFYRMTAEELPEEYRDRAGVMGGFLTRHSMGDEVFEELANRVSDSCNFTVVYNPAPTDQDRKAIDEQMQDILHRELETIDWNDFND